MTEKKCGMCYGHGLWAMGDHAPMGDLDALEGYPTIACPECGANANPDSFCAEPVEFAYVANAGSGLVCDNCGKRQGENDWFTRRGGHWWCTECQTIVHQHEKLWGTLVVTCPECSWLITASLGGGSTTRDRTEPDDPLGKLLAKVTPENTHGEEEL